MTNDDIIKMAREAGIGVKKDLEDWHVPVWHLGIDYLVRFADLVAKRAVSNIDPASWMSYREGCAAGVAAEREACAKVCDEIGDYAEAEHVNYPHWTPWGAARECALKIRLKEKS